MQSEFVPFLLLQPYGHANLCFGCVQGLTHCPICVEAITGWHWKLAISLVVNPLVLSLTNAFDASKEL